MAFLNLLTLHIQSPGKILLYFLEVNTFESLPPCPDYTCLRHAWFPKIYTASHTLGRWDTFLHPVMIPRGDRQFHTGEIYLGHRHNFLRIYSVWGYLFRRVMLQFCKQVSLSIFKYHAPNFHADQVET